MEDGIAKMRPVKGGLEIKPGETVELKPGSFHVMFVGLKKPLSAGDQFKATLVFEKAGNGEHRLRRARDGLTTRRRHARHEH